jgi:hypothetical protein
MDGALACCHAVLVFHRRIMILAAPSRFVCACVRIHGQKRMNVYKGTSVSSKERVCVCNYDRYAPDQRWLNKRHIIGRAVGSVLCLCLCVCVCVCVCVCCVCVCHICCLCVCVFVCCVRVCRLSV